MIAHTLSKTKIKTTWYAVVAVAAGIVAVFMASKGAQDLKELKSYHVVPGYNTPGYQPPGYTPPGYQPPGYKPVIKKPIKKIPGY